MFAFAEDVAASGGYWLALRGRRDLRRGSSLVGSIGVVTASFGFDRLIERSASSAACTPPATRKALLDPFLPEGPADVARLNALQQDIHDSFKEQVREPPRRQDRTATMTSLFSGEV